MTATDVERAVHRRLKHAFKTGTRLVDQHPHRYNAIILAGILLTGLLKFICLRSCTNNAAAAATADMSCSGDADWLAASHLSAPAIGHPDHQPPSAEAIQAALIRLPMGIIGLLRGVVRQRQELLHCPEVTTMGGLIGSLVTPLSSPEKSAAAEGSRLLAVLRDHLVLILSLLLLLLLLLLGLVLACWMKTKPTQLQLVAGRWRYTPTLAAPAHYSSKGGC